MQSSLQVWDTNTAQPACTFPFGAAVFGVGMSPVAAAHCLVAVAGGQPQIKLCDPASGSFTHVLGGHAGSQGSHREAVWSLHWSLQSEWHLVTGGCDGQVFRPKPLLDPAKLSGRKSDGPEHDLTIKQDMQWIGQY